jgi:glycosyltransferase involved in cell wall biosynthesis
MSDALTLMLIFKNEAPYLAEWLAFYQAQGVTRIIVFDHGSTDEYREVLARFPEVELRQAELTNQAQNNAYNQVLAECSTPWLAGLDIDEFLFWPGQPSFLPYLEGIDQEGTAGLILPWRQMQSRDETKPPGLVIENFRWRRIRGPRPGAIKLLVRPVGVERYLTSHRAIARPWWTFRKDDHLHLNHYFSKSREEFERKRHKGGTGLSAPGRVPDPVPPEAYDGYNGEPALPDDGILALVAQTRRRLEQAYA